MSAQMGQYYVRMGTQLLGPLSWDQLKSLRDRGRLQPFHSISADGRTWQPASSLTDLFPPEEKQPPKTEGAASPGQSSVADPQQESWYYLGSDKNQVGPLPQSKLLELVLNKVIGPDTYVWKQGMDSWKQLQEVIPLPGQVPTQLGRRFYRASVAWWIGIASVGVLILVAVIIAFWVPSKPHRTVEELFNQNFKSVPMLVRPDKGASGSGFILSAVGKRGERWFIATNKHVLLATEGKQALERLPFRPKCRVLIFERRDGRTVSIVPADSLEVRYVHPDADIALMECTQARHRLEEWGVKPLRLAPRNYELQPGAEVVVIGHPTPNGEELLPITYTKGQIAGPEREIDGIRYHQLQVPVAPGNSGGPVLDMSGQVVGIVTLGVRLNNQGQFNFALHLKYLYELLDQVP